MPNPQRPSKRRDTGGRGTPPGGRGRLRPPCHRPCPAVSPTRTSDAEHTTPSLLAIPLPNQDASPVSHLWFIMHLRTVPASVGSSTAKRRQEGMIPRGARRWLPFPTCPGVERCSERHGGHHAAALTLPGSIWYQYDNGHQLPNVCAVRASVTGS